ncbi:MAG: RepB family DNA primase, partial [Anaerolineae bacterium]|nr:RepB family DNA primase [Anaerolineae bacterium]
MTQNTTDHNTKTVTQAEFLDMLYPQPQEDLYLELRCIHPETGEVRTLWTQIGNAKQRNSALKQVEKLNNEGYGVYYAPCLRQTKQGKSESAAQVPALWVDIDCDDDPARREVGLAALHGFVLQPSAIVDSGGGWHAYWLLNAPFSLQSEDDRQRIAHVLHGLFSALDGDSGYVKSVASVMRLPGSTNTKPSRNNALVE